MNGALVPRKAGCWVCDKLASSEDVTVRLFSEDGTRRQGRGATAEAARYVTGMGYAMSSNLLNRRLTHHADHIEAGMTATVVRPGNLTRLEPAGPAHWLDVNQNAVNIGNEALGAIQARIPDMEDKELVAVAKLGVTAAQKVGDWEAKGRKLAQIGDLIRLASGFVEGGDDGSPV